ncbi:10705_t:CDS:2 [Gigaspora margarita]|uniref:10705_t:CDS:1 n=1 Tax=Gigaspora margarita TaxID=4874 RepID=A0ABN7VD55_GIGMA|nr:10705_t:CDS:2 [Gigaspora margarita]
MTTILLNENLKNGNSEYKKSQIGYLSEYNISQSWPSDDDIRIAVDDAFKEVATLAKFCGMSNSRTLVSHELLLAIFTEPDENSKIQSQSLSNNEAIINGANEICNSLVYEHNKLSDNPFLHEEARMQINFLLNKYESIVKYNRKIDFEKLEVNSTDIVTQPSLNLGKASELVVKLQKNSNKTHKPTIREFLPDISFANISNIHPAEIFGYAFALFYDRIHLVQILSMFSKTNSTFHSYIDVPVKAIDLLSYISVKVFIHYQSGIFCSCGHSKYNVFSHISAKQVIYYLGKSAILQENSALGLGMVTLQSQALQIFETLNTEATISFLIKCTNQK